MTKINAAIYGTKVLLENLKREILLKTCEHDTIQKQLRSLEKIAQDTNSFSDSRKEESK